MSQAKGKVIRIALVASLALALGGGAASALECPALQSLDGSSAAPDLKGQLASKDVIAQVPGILGALHQQFPSVSKALLVNYLIAAYCPVVKADAALSDEEKMAKVREFADKVVSSAY